MRKLTPANRRSQKICDAYLKVNGRPLTGGFAYLRSLAYTSFLKLAAAKGDFTEANADILVLGCAHEARIVFCSPVSGLGFCATYVATSKKRLNEEPRGQVSCAKF